MTLSVPVAIAPPSSPEAPDEPSREALLAAYAEVCVSYHAIDDFRTKLLSILPISSLAGILLVGKDSLFASNDPPALELALKLIGFGSFFAAAFTLGLFLFEIRGILRCHHLIQRGEELERELKVRGQFFVCKQQHGQNGNAERIFNAKVAASAIYSLVFSAWLFMALKFSFGVTIIGCGLTATILGGVLAMGTFRLVSKRIAA